MNEKAYDCERLWAWLVGVYELDIDTSRPPTESEINRVRQQVLGTKRDSESYRTLARAIESACNAAQLESI